MTDYRFEDFTEDGYRRLLELGSRSYTWEFFGCEPRGRHIILRHDVDISPQRALAMARLEAGLGVRATYLWLFHSDYYNLLEPRVAAIVREIAGLGHRTGLHFDLSFYEGVDDVPRLTRHLARERALLADVAGADVDVFSFHNPDTNSSLSFRDDHIAGMVNTYGSGLARDYKYVSDSNGYWRFDDAFARLGDAAFERFHVLIHPEWWTPEALSPRARLERALRGRASAAGALYDAQLASWKRTNVR